MEKWLCLSLLVLEAAILSAQEASTVRAIQVDGAVEMKRADDKEWTAVREGGGLGRGEVIRCKEQSAAILSWSNGSLVKIYPGTTLALQGVTFELDKKIEKTLITLEQGRIFVKGQVPDHLFCHFEVRMGNQLFVLTQGAEFALKYEPGEKSYTAAALIGRVVTEIGNERIRIEEGQQAAVKEGEKFNSSSLVALDDKAKESLRNTSSSLGGSLLVEEEGGETGGKLSVKIGGVRNRRGTAPYKVKFKAKVSGGSGRAKKLAWNFGDGGVSSEKEPEYTFTQGVYVVILRVEDENGEKASAQLNISAEEDCNC